jgi:hypothetical protein
MLILVVGGFYTFLAYRKAKEKGRSPIRWALIAAATFIGTQILIAGGIGFVLGLGTELWGWSENLFYRYNLQITIVSLLASAFTNWLALRPLNKTSDEPFNHPPPPPVFESSEN